MRLLAFTLLGMVGCGSTWDLSRPISLLITSPEIDRPVAELAFSQAVHQLGGQLAAGDQLIYMDYDPNCAFPQEGRTMQSAPNRMVMCLPTKKGPEVLQDAVFHELGRTLGYWGYLDCSTGGIMTPEYHCRTVHNVYLDVDKVAICSTGQTGGICASR